MDEKTAYQLKQWVIGNSVHNKEKDECVPDFSCCNDKMNTSKETKERFCRAVELCDERTKNEILGIFLAQAIQTIGKNVYVAGLEIPTSEH